MNKYRISDLCDVVKGTTAIQNALPGEYPLVVTAEERASSNEYQFECKAVCVPLVSSTGHGHASIKRIHYQEGKFALGSILAAIIPKDEKVLNAKYLYTYLSFFKDSILVPLMKGSANVALTVNSLLSALIVVPDMDEQMDIIKMVDSTKLEFEEVYQKMSIQMEYVKKLKQSILQEALQGKLVQQNPNDEPASLLLEEISKEKERLIKEGKIKKEKLLPPITEDEIPFELSNGWEWIRLGKLVSKVGAGSTPTGGKNVYSGSGIKFIRSQNVWNDGLYLDDVAYISEEINDKMKGSIVEKEDILLNITGASIGRSCIVPSDFDIGNVNQHVSIIRLIDKKINEFIHYCMISPYIQKTIMDVQVGVSREGLSMAKLSNFIIPIPPLDEQKRIVEKVDCLMSLCNELERNIEQSQKDGELLMQSVLQEAFKEA